MMEYHPNTLNYGIKEIILRFPQVSVQAIMQKLLYNKPPFSLKSSLKSYTPSHIYILVDAF